MRNILYKIKDEINALNALLKLDGVDRIRAALGNDSREVVGQHERHALSLDAQLGFHVAEEVAEVDVKQLVTTYNTSNIIK